MIRRDCELQRYIVIVAMEKAVTVTPPYTEKTLRRADDAFECSINAYMYQFKCGWGGGESLHFETSADMDECYLGGHADIRMKNAELTSYLLLRLGIRMTLKHVGSCISAGKIAIPV